MDCIGFRKWHVWSLWLLLGLGMAQPVPAAIHSLPEAINKAGRQRMLTQRMMKNYALIGLQVQQDKARKELHAAVQLFERQLAELRAFAPTPAIRRALERVVHLWRPFRQRILQPPDRRTAVALLEPNDALLAAAHKVVLQLEDVAGTTTGRLVNIAGRQRMLSQRLAKFYMLRAWGIDNATVRSEVSRARNEFQGALGELIAAPENTPRLRRALDAAREQWNLFKHALDRRGDDFVPLIVAVTSEQLLQTMDRITALYQALGERR